jgi:aldehyde:ferredoxin oxidoreductase
LQSHNSKGTKNISGKALPQHYLARRLACSHCPVPCIHIAALPEPHPKEPYFYKTSMIAYDYEPTYALGSMLGIGDPVGMLKLMDRVEAVGLGAMTTGVGLAWGTEGQQRGLVGTAETAGLTLSFGDADPYIKAVDLIVKHPTEFYRCLAQGVDAAAQRYGGLEFALSMGGNEMPGYHTGPGAHLGFLIGARHSHLDNAGYSIDQKNLVQQLVPPGELVRMIVAEERWRQVLSSLVICFFARGIYQPELVVGVLRASGFELSADELQQIAAVIHQQKYRFKLREGFSVDELRLPKRLFETPATVGGWDEAYMREAVRCFRESILEQQGQ